MESENQYRTGIDKEPWGFGRKGLVVPPEASRGRTKPGRWGRRETAVRGDQQGPKWNVCPRCDPKVTQPTPPRPETQLIWGQCNGGLLVPRGSAKLNSRGPRNLCDSALHQEVEGGQAAKVQERAVPTCRLLPSLEKVLLRVLGGLGRAQDEKGKSECRGEKKTGRRVAAAWNLPQLEMKYYEP